MMLGKTCIGSIGYTCQAPMVFEGFCRSWGQMIQYNAEHVCKPGQYIEQVFSHVHKNEIARNELVSKMRGDWLFQVDYDHTFEPDLVARLLHRMDAYGVDVVVGLYHERYPPFKPLIYMEREPGRFYQIGDWPDEPFRIGAAGCGCLMVKKSVFRRIKDELGEEPFGQRGALLDDLSFFLRCSELGIPVLCDPRIQHPHLSIKGVTSADYDRTAFPLFESA